MGNKASISVQLDQREFSAGKSLTGKVVIKVIRSMSFSRGGSLKVRVEGWERNGVKDRCCARRIEHQFFRADRAVHEFEGKVHGVHSFPFAIDLPASLPCTTKYRLKLMSRNGFRIEYTCIVEIESKDIRYECPVSISSARSVCEQHPCMIEPASHPVHGMLHRGKIAIGASTANSHVDRGTSFGLCLACRNESTANIRSVDIKLIERLQWSSVGKGKFNNNAEFIRITLHDVHISGLEKRGRSRADVKKAEAVDMTAYIEILDELESGHSNISFVIPHEVRNSYEGKIVQISHFLDIMIRTGRFSNDISLQIPLRVGSSSLHNSVVGGLGGSTDIDNKRSSVDLQDFTDSIAGPESAVEDELFYLRPIPPPPPKEIIISRDGNPVETNPSAEITPIEGNSNESLQSCRAGRYTDGKHVRSMEI